MANAAGASTTTTLSEAIPTIVASALLELDEGDVVGPLVTNIDFTGPGILHQTPFINRLTSETDDTLASQTLEASTSDETSPSAATVGVHGAYVSLKDIAALATVDDMAAVAGKLIGQCLTVRKDLDLVTLFASFTTNQGAALTNMVPADLYDAYGSLRTYHAAGAYNLVLHPQQIWSVVGLISFFDNSSDAISGSAAPGSVSEEFTRNGWAGKVLGFDLYSDANIVLTSYNGSGAAFAKEGIKLVVKRGFMIELERETSDVATGIVGHEIHGEAILRNLHGNEMQFDTV